MFCVSSAPPPLNLILCVVRVVVRVRIIGCPADSQPALRPKLQNGSLSRPLL